MQSLRSSFCATVGGGQPAVLIRTDEPDEAAYVVSEVAKEYQWHLWVWDFVNGLEVDGRPRAKPAAGGRGADPLAKDADGPTAPGGVAGLQQALRALATFNNVQREGGQVAGYNPVVLVVKNLPMVAPAPEVRQEIANHLKTFEATNKCLVGFGHASSDLPPEVRPAFTLLDHELPGPEDLAKVALSIGGTNDWQPTADEIVEIAENGLGLTRLQLKNIVSAYLFDPAEACAELIDDPAAPPLKLPEYVWRMKTAVLNKEGLVTVLNPRFGFDKLGGLHGLKDFHKRLLTSAKLQGTGKDRPKAKARGTMLVSGPGMGKAQPLHTPVLTPEGYVKMGEIAPGDFVVGADGRPTEVLGVYPQGELDVFTVTFSDGSRTQCCADHLWLTATRRERKNAQRRGAEPFADAKVRTTAQIAETLRSADGHANHYVPLVSPVEYASTYVPPIDPYVLGVLLGDGCLTLSGVTYSKPDEELTKLVQAGLGTDLVATRRAPGGRARTAITYTGPAITGRRGRPNPLADSLVSLGLKGRKSSDRFVPPAYLTLPAADRLALLQGLLDTDGSAAGPVVEYTTTSEQLAADAVHLVESLGGTAHVTWRRTTYTHNGETRTGRPSARIRISLPAGLPPFRLTRKAKRYAPRTKYQPRRQIVSVERAGRYECQCIRVAAADRLYVTERFVVTHNTTFIECLAYEVGAGAVMMDFGSMLGGHVGDTEKTTRRAFAVVDAIAPREGTSAYAVTQKDIDTFGDLVVPVMEKLAAGTRVRFLIVGWDEVEKALSGANAGHNAGLDSGVNSRQFEFVLRWLTTRKSRTFVVATANNAANLNSAFTRSGRFTAVFYLEKPDREQKDDIWRIAIRKYGLDRVAPVVVRRDKQFWAADPLKGGTSGKWVGDEAAATSFADPAEADELIAALKAKGAAVFPKLPDDTDWTGAEIDDCCEKAYLLDKPLVEAAKHVVPVFKRDKEGQAALEEWAKGATLSARTGELYGTEMVSVGTGSAFGGRVRRTVKRAAPPAAPTGDGDEDDVG